MTYRMDPDWRRMHQLEGRGIVVDTLGPTEGWSDDYILPEDRPAVFAAIADAVRSKSLFELEHRVRRADGSIGWVHSRAVPMLGPEGEVVEWFGAGSDVTGRHTAQERLRESEARLAAMFELLPMAVGVFDVQRALILSNQEMRRFMPTGVLPSRDEARRSRWRAWHPDGRLVEPEDFPGARALRGERVVPGIEMLHTDDGGREVWTTVSAVPLKDGGGRVAEAAIVVADIDALKRGAEALRASEERHRLAMAAVEAMVFDWDVPSGRVARSEGLRRLLGYDPEEAAETPDWWTERIHPEDRARLGWPAREAMAAGAPRFEAQVRMRHCGGHWLDVLDTGTILYGADGRASRIVGSSVDVTERKRAEAALRDSEARFRALATVGSSSVYRMSPNWREMRQLDGAAFLVDTEAPTTSWIDTYIPCDERPRVREAIDRAIGAKDVFELEHRVLGADGTVRWVFSRAIPLLDEAGVIAEWFGAATDVTARVKADQSFTRLFQASPAPFLVVKPDAPRFTIIEVNDAYLAATMRTRDTVVGRGIFEAYPDNSHSAASSGVSTLLASLERVLASRQPDALPGLKYDIARPDGTFEERWWDPINSPVLDENGKVEAIIHNANDVTEERHAEAALRESEERLRQFGDASQDVLWMRDANTLDWTYLTPAFETIYGLNREEALSGDNYRNWQDLILPEDRAHAAESIQRVARGEQVAFEYRIRRPLDGKVRWLRDTDFPMRGADGQVQHIGGVGHDVSAMKEAEEALAAAEQRQRLLLEGIPQLVWRAVGDGHWTWASPQWTERTGLTDEASRGHGWLEALHPGDRDAALAAWGQAKVAGLYQADYRVRHAVSGHYHWFQSRGIPIYRADGSVAEWLGTTTDIDAQVRAREFLTRAGEELEQRVTERTAELQQALNTLHQETQEREQAEERLRQSEKLKAVGQLTGGIAHDFNNMLQGITSALALVRTRLAQNRYTDAAAYIEPAVKAATRAGALTHRLLAFARQQTLAPGLVTLDQVAQGMEDMIRRTVGPAVQVELKSADGRWLVLCDPNQMESALLNLCVNARDAMPDGGWLTISTEERVLSAEEVAGFEDLQPGRYASLAVTDTGTGMPPDVLARVFEPFYTTKPLGQGTGLGMSQIYGFMRQSGGLVQIETAVGKGTTVRLCLPFQEMNTEEHSAPLANGRTLLLVEDEHDVRGMLAEQLRDLGYRVLEADTAAAAVRVLNTGVNVDMLVTDVGLRGGTNGRELADTAREKTSDLPVIFITGFAGIEALSGEDVVRKPFETATLAHLIEERLSTAAGA